MGKRREKGEHREVENGRDKMRRAGGVVMIIVFIWGVHTWSKKCGVSCDAAC